MSVAFVTFVIVQLLALAHLHIRYLVAHFYVELIMDEVLSHRITAIQHLQRSRRPSVGPQQLNPRASDTTQGSKSIYSTTLSVLCGDARVEKARWVEFVYGAV